MRQLLLIVVSDISASYVDSWLAAPCTSAGTQLPHMKPFGQVFGEYLQNCLSVSFWHQQANKKVVAGLNAL